jgi:hypothetical protein
MKKNNLILLVAIIIVIIIAIVCVYYFMPNSQNSAVAPNTSANIPPPPTPEEQLAQIKKDYPQVITGVINFLDTKTSLKTTLRTDDGTVYTLWPVQPESIYKSLGAKDGGRVEVQAKIVGNGQLLEVGSMKPI